MLRTFITKSFGTLLLAVALLGCDGDNSDGNYPPPGPGPGPVDPKPEATPLAVHISNLGGTYAADGLVTVLVYDSATSTFAAQNQERDGRTLYVFDNDAVGSSACTSATCVTNWPPFLANDNSQAVPPLSLVDRGDGHRQWALDGKPLYFFKDDAAAGDLKGEGVGGVWHTALAEPVLLRTLEDPALGAFWAARGNVLTTAPEPAGQNLVFAATAVNKAGFSLYTFANDSPGVSNCAGNCLVNWPALLAHPGETAEPPFSIIERTLGANGGPARQWAYQGRPLYFFINDVTPGETKGAAIPNWALARPLPWRIATTDAGSAFVAAGLALTAAPDANGATVVTATPKHGFALYTFDNDGPGLSNCTEACLTNWPALAAHPGAQPAGPFTVIARGDGANQWALNGRPLYFFKNDLAAGDIAGDGLNNVWHLARVPPVAAQEHPTEGTLFAAIKGLVNAAGVADDTLAGFTLYTFGNDTGGVSTCFGDCASAWPPLYAPADARDFGDFKVTVRNDPTTPDDDASNIRQWSYKNQPLYFYVGDTQPGDVTGEYGTWFIAGP